jgi:hypothetical protein
MTEHIREDFCGTCALAAGALFTGVAGIVNGGVEEDEEDEEEIAIQQGGGITWDDIFIWGGILLILLAIAIYFYGPTLAQCTSCM